MLRKGIRYALGLGLLLLVGYNSVYIKKLNEVQAAAATGKFNAAAYAQSFWKEKLTPGLAAATDLGQLLVLLQADKDSAFKTHSNALGIGNLRYFLVKGKGEIRVLHENDLTLVLQPETKGTAITVATEFIYGNAVRDALGLMDINDFSNTMDMNTVSAEINKKIRTDILPPFLAKARQGSQVQFTGALELNQQHLRLNKIEVIPITLQLVDAQ
jgi:predicted lipoprotein